MNRCAACGHENQAEARFCSQCAAPMVEAPAPSREERKVVTVLFADLVGFTSRSEQLDPEDVRAFLNPYYQRLRTELERFGGTVEKFIGDAVMALFGAPVAHEDDPERAVRAALAIRDWVLEDGEGLQLRIGVTTGEALIALGTRPAHGEGMASGDVVNTAARLQTAAPVNGILVGEVTHRATSSVITYRAADAVSAKGKTLPVPAWEAVEARSRFGADLARVSRAPLAGRQREVSVLREALQRVRSDRSTQLVTLAGVPGMGKSRLVAELFRVIEDDPSELIAWRQGRSLPYGDGVTFWALAEMVKAHAGILETDSPGVTEEKLIATVTSLIPVPADAQWVEGHLRPLAGLKSTGIENGDAGREEAFAAWRRFFEAIAEHGPLVLIFEDLHCADDNLLDFIDHLVGWAGGVPILVVATTRPELFDRRPGWGGGLRNSTTLWLEPLTDAETADLIISLNDHPAMTVDTHLALLERAGGNPLYAEQYVRMLEERGPADEMPLPETVQGIIAARLDGLPAEEKRLLQSAAVIGKVFWIGALAHVGAFDPRAAEMHLHQLERKDFVQRTRRSSVAAETEFSFLHVLVRDVAYGQIPRPRRGEQHRLTAEWIASLGRTEDNAEMLAHHYRYAIELRRAAGQPIDAALALRGLESMRDAGDRAYSLNAYANAVDFYQSALELAADGSIEHGHVLLQLGLTKYQAGDFDTSSLETASAELLALGDREAAADAQALLSELYSRRGDQDRGLACLASARQLVDGIEPTPVKARVINRAAGMMMGAGDHEAAIRLGREALAIAEQLGLNDVRAHALNSIGCARCDSGDAKGIEDLEQSLDVAVAARSLPDIFRAQVNLASVLWEQGQLDRAYALCEEAHRAARGFGRLSEARWARGRLVEYQLVLGRWPAALGGADTFLTEVEAGSPHALSAGCYASRAVVRLGGDDVKGALADVARALELARRTKEPAPILLSLGICADIYRQTGDMEEARALAEEALSWLHNGEGAVIDYLHVLAWSLTAFGRGQELIPHTRNRHGAWARATRSFVDGDLRQAADLCEEMGAVSEEARDRLWLAEALIQQGRRSEADVELQRALGFYRSVAATRYIRQAESLLAASAS